VPHGGREAGSGAGIAAGKRRRARKPVAAEERRLIHGPAEGRPDARDGPVVVGEVGEPPQQLLVLGERHVVEERVAPVEESGQSARGHVADETVALAEIEAAPALGPAGERGHGEHAAQVVGGERYSLHRAVLGRDSTPPGRDRRPGPRPTTYGGRSTRPAGPPRSDRSREGRGAGMRPCTG